MHFLDAFIEVFAGLADFRCEQSGFSRRAEPLIDIVHQRIARHIV